MLTKHHQQQNATGDAKLLCMSVIVSGRFTSECTFLGVYWAKGDAAEQTGFFFVPMS